MSLIDHFNILYSEYTKRLQKAILIADYEEISLATYPYIMSIYDAKKITVSELAIKNGVKKASVSQMLDRLIKTGYASKSRDNKDKRIVYVKLTEKGKQLIDTETKVYEEFISEISSVLSESEWNLFELLLGRLAKEAAK